VDSGNAPDGTACASGGNCQAGTCKRTVSGTFQTIYWTDNGTKTTVSGTPSLSSALGDPPVSPSALLVPDASTTGYTKLPLPLAADLSFAAASVPVGSYLLEVDATTTGVAVCGGVRTPVTIVNLFELTTSNPDLAYVTSARPDVVTPQTAPSVTFDITNMDPWVSGDRLFVASSQARTFQIILPVPAGGATSLSPTFGWFGGLPDASKNDSVFVYQRTAGTIGSGNDVSSLARVTKSAQLTNLTVVEGSNPSTAVALGDTPQTGSLSTDLRSSQFAALAADVNPGAVLNSFSVTVLAVPHSTTYPDKPFADLSSIFSLVGTSAADVDYGSVAYGQFFGTLWKEERRVVYLFDVPSEGSSATLISSQAVADLAAGGVTPVVGPPKTPQVNGANAFAAQTGVGLQPTISWSAPALGTATSYVVDVVAASPCSLNGQVAGVSAVIRSGTSFKVPPGILIPGRAYRATITARQAPWDTANAGPFRTGTPLHSAQCVTSTFVP
jgi:hypothetical protein